jgi:hypothetical protein
MCLKYFCDCWMLKHEFCLKHKEKFPRSKDHPYSGETKSVKDSLVYCSIGVGTASTHCSCIISKI